MNTEQKAQAYDKALERAREWYNDPHITIGLKGNLKDIFPELKESEDEKIRKELIDFVKSRLAGFPKCDRFISWLEKQSERKPTDKVEPKFHEGDFIVAPYCRGKIIALTFDAYLLDTGQGIPFSCEYNVHLWTIEDAKDGDVLIASDESIFIYAGSTDRHAKFYLALTKCGKLNVDGGNWEDKNSVHPATKEQRDVLFTKMKEAGYEWDAEKKELKKIENEPENYKQHLMSGITDLVKDYIKQKPTWSEEDDKISEDIIRVFKGEISFTSEKENKKYIDWLKSLKEKIGG